INRTTAVGMYPEGRSLQDVYDLAGNVWEWCRNSYTDLREKTPEQDAPRVVRGGSWLSARGGARAGARYGFRPIGRSADGVFRVVCAAPILR
ncbi:MAG: SUMF1/EgtB/PvdO family nonheme iron enzyme, partial [Accumulibacter sp.]|uniref:formylglycine-generating enzyme family protein n=1 Tax=Accumulibacter sp. TaxID=2053492 RepID=UPI0033149F6F